MTEKQLRLIAKKCGYNRPLYFYHSKRHPCFDFGGVTYFKTGNIALNREVVFKRGYHLFAISLILHEIGHHATNKNKLFTCNKVDDYQREVIAQMWAINKAMTLGWIGVAKFMTKQISKNWRRKHHGTLYNDARVCYLETMLQKR